MESSLKKKALLAGVSCLLMIALAVIILFAAQGPDKIEVDCSEGIALIHSQESGSIDSVRKIIQDIRKSKLREECEERIEVLQNDNSKVWPMFEDFLFFGDSRCVALVYDGYFTDTQCIAEYGVNIRSHLEPNISLIEAAQPAYVYLAYGVNDISCGNWTTGSAYAEEYAKIVDEIHAASPDTKIYVNSILLAFDSAFERYSGFRLIPDWNEYLRDMCTSRSYCYYVDNDSICNEYRWLYDSDDVHVLKDFYPIWAANIMITQYRNELEDQLNGVDSSNSGSTDGESGSQDGEGQDGESTDMSYRMEGGVRS